MKTLLQRVKQASVTVNEQVCGKIDKGLLVLFGVHKNDTPDKTEWLVKKILHLRLFTDENGKMNKNIMEEGGNFLVVSQFTLYADCSQGLRPDFGNAALPEPAFLFYEKFLQELSMLSGLPIQTGIFGAKMEVHSINDGPASFLLER